MAIAFDAFTAGRNWQTGDPQTWSHTCSGSDRCLFVALFTSGTTTITGVTYGGVSMTKVPSTPITDLDGNENWVYYLANPASGTNTVSVDLDTSANLSGLSVSYTGVDQTTPVDDYASEDGTLASPTYTSNAVTVSATDAWLLSFFRNTDSSTITATGGVSTKRGGTTTVREEAYDSNGTVTTGSKTASYSLSPSARLHGHTLISLAPAGSSPTNTSNFFLMM